MDPNEAASDLTDVRYVSGGGQTVALNAGMASVYPQWNSTEGIEGPGLMAMNPFQAVNPQMLAPRKGKWSEEEELLTKKLISAFYDGYLRIPVGTTLRTFLSEMLFW